jgi:hypothetical protein
VWLFATARVFSHGHRPCLACASPPESVVAVAIRSWLAASRFARRRRQPRWRRTLRRSTPLVFRPHSTRAGVVAEVATSTSDASSNPQRRSVTCSRAWLSANRTPAVPAAQRRLSAVCAPGALERRQHTGTSLLTAPGASRYALFQTDRSFPRRRCCARHGVMPPRRGPPLDVGGRAPATVDLRTVWSARMVGCS